MLFIFDMVHHTYWFAYVEPSLYRRDKYHLIMVCDPFIYLFLIILLLFKYSCLHLPPHHHFSLTPAIPTPFPCF